MSHSYKVQVQGVRLVNAEGRRHRKVRLQMLPILKPSRMRELAREEVLRHEFVEDDEQETLHRNLPELEAGLIFDPQSGVFEITLQREDSFNIELDGEFEVKDIPEEKAADSVFNREAYRAEQAFQHKMDQDFEEIQEQAMELLVPVMDEIRASVHRQALLEKAGSMGEIESVTDEDGETTIRVKL